MLAAKASTRAFQVPMKCSRDACSGTRPYELTKWKLPAPIACSVSWEALTMTKLTDH